MATPQNPEVRVNNQGIGFIGALTCIFAAAKVFGFSNMSWLWVFSPVWIGAAITVGILLLLGAAYGVAVLIDWRRTVKRRKAAAERREALRTGGFKTKKVRRY